MGPADWWRFTQDYASRFPNRERYTEQRGMLHALNRGCPAAKQMHEEWTRTILIMALKGKLK